jgi:hypothetical protein
MSIWRPGVKPLNAFHLLYSIQSSVPELMLTRFLCWGEVHHERQVLKVLPTFTSISYTTLAQALFIQYEITQPFEARFSAE